MAAAIGKFAANKLLKKQMAQYQGKKVGGDTDPYFAYVTNPRTGKKKKVRKQIPSYIPEHDALILAKMRSRAYKLDMGLFNIGPVRFGYSSVIGIIPGFGDVADTLLALMLYSRCRQVSCGLGDAGLWMILNIIIDTIVGFIPILGDLADAAFKANTRNVRLLEKRLDEVYKPKELAAQQERMFKEKPHMRKEHQPATNFEDFSDEEDDRRAFIREQDAQDGTRRPEPTAPKNSKGGGRGWFGGDRKPERRPDVEMAQTAPIRPPRTDAGDYQETGTVVSGGR